MIISNKQIMQLINIANLYCDLIHSQKSMTVHELRLIFNAKKLIDEICNQQSEEQRVIE